MHFRHAPDIWRDFPELVPGVLLVRGITPDADISDRVEVYTAIARSRVVLAPEGEMPAIQAWRRAFSRMGLKPTQYRCASESLLRRLRKEGPLPAIHPLVDLCNAVSVAFATPIAIFDLAHVTGGLEVRRATGDERFATFSGEVEHPGPGEAIFADEAGTAHARRWTHRQSGASAVQPSTSDILIVAEAMHASAREDIERLVATLSGELRAAWQVTPTSAVLGVTSPRFDW